MADAPLLDKIHGLSDLELAALLCLVAREHCLVGTEPDSVDELAEELRLIASKTFNLSSAIISCHAHTTLDEFATGLLVPSPSRGPPSPNPRSVSPYRPRYEQPQPSTGGPSSSAGSYFPITPTPRTAPGSLSPRIGSAVNPSSPAVGSGASHTHGPHQPRIANVILAKDLDRAPRSVQIQALELLRTRRIFTRTSVQTAPKQFLFIALVGAASGGQARVTPHLNDFFYLAHWHDPEEDGFPYLDEEFVQVNRAGAGVGDEELDDGASTASSSSVVKHVSSLGASGLGLAVTESKWLAANNSSTSSSGSSIPKPTPYPLHQQQTQAQHEHCHHHHQRSPNPEPSQEPSASTSPPPLLTESDISLLAQLTQQAHVDVDVTRYQLNLVCFLRTHRAVAGGVSPAATKHLERLARSLAPLHGLDYVTPSLVSLAARKVYLHRVRVVAEPERERSVQWGSDRAAVAQLLEGVGPEEVIEDVIGLVGVPN